MLGDELAVAPSSYTIQLMTVFFKGEMCWRGEELVTYGVQRYGSCYQAAATVVQHWSHWVQPLLRHLVHIILEAWFLDCSVGTGKGLLAVAWDRGGGSQRAQAWPHHHTTEPNQTLASACMPGQGESHVLAHWLLTELSSDISLDLHGMHSFRDEMLTKQHLPSSAIGTENIIRQAMVLKGNRQKYSHGYLYVKTPE